MMDQEKIVEGVGSHLDSFNKTLGLALLAALGFALAGLSDVDPVKALGFEIVKLNAFVVAAIFYIFINLKILGVLLRLGN